QTFWLLDRVDGPRDMRRQAMRFEPLENRALLSTFTWIAGAGPDTNWSTPANWSVTGAADNDGVPDSNDDVVFNGTNTGNSTVDSTSFSGTVQSMSVNSGYIGTITLNTSLTVSGTLTLSAGTVTLGSNTLDVGALAISGGSLSGDTATINITGDMSLSSGTL